MILFKDDIFYILALSLSSFSDFQSLAESKILLSSVCGHGVAEGEDVVTDVVNACLQHRGSESSSRALQGWKPENSFEKYFVVRSIFLAKEVLFDNPKKYICAVNHICDRKTFSFGFLGKFG